MNKYFLSFCKISLLLYIVFIFSQLSYATNESNKPKKSKENLKILVLIITSDDYPVYIELQKIWRSYMHYNPAQVEAYFIRGNPNLSSDFEIQGDILWTKTQENLIPGILNKTILSMEAMLPRLEEFDYILRPNLSSFYIFPRLLKFLETAPQNNFYCGALGFVNTSYASGSGFILSADLVYMLVKNKDFLLNNAQFDDVLIGNFLYKQGIKVQAQKRMDFTNINAWNNNKNNIPSDIFQFRVKNDNHHMRLSQDIYIHQQLLKMFYQ